MVIGETVKNIYGILLALAWSSALVISVLRAKNKEIIVNVFIVALVFGMIGAKWLFFITNKHLGSTNGFAIYGGLILGILINWFYCSYVMKINFGEILDLAVPSIAIAQGIGRIGCLLDGCCHGIITTDKFYVVYTHSNKVVNGLHLVPTQLLSSIFDLLLGVLLLILSKKIKRAWDLSGIYLILYGIGRFIIEFYRGDMERGWIGVLSTSQFISIIGIIIGTAIIARKSKIK